MPDLSHERERLHKAVDNFIEHYEAMDDDYPDLRIDTFGIVSIGTWTEDDGEGEAPFMWFEARRNHVQLGVLNTCLLELKSSYYTAPQADD